MKVKELRDLLKVERITDDMDVILFNGSVVGQVKSA